MSKRCPGCGQMNDDARIFCNACGEPLNADLRLIQNFEKQKSIPSKAQPASQQEKDDDYIPPKKTEKKKANPAPWIILGLAALAVVLWLVLH